MADLVVTAANVVKAGSVGTSAQSVFGETVTAGQAVYLKASDNKWYKALSDAAGGSIEKSGSGTSIGIALNGGSAGQPAVVATSGPVTIGATIAVGIFYYLSNTAGGLCPVADLATGDFVTIIGYGLSTTVLQIAPVATGLTLA